MNAIIKEIWLFVLNKIVPDYQGVKPHSDSTTEMKTSVFQSNIKQMSTFSDKIKY